VTPQERADLWPRLEAEAYEWEPEEVEAYVVAMRDTLSGQLTAVQYAVDDLARTHPVGTMIAFLFFGWRPREARARDRRLSSTFPDLFPPKGKP
jgi:hypothetical protein